MTLRRDGRLFDQLRSIKVTPNIQKDPDGSVLIEWGNTHVLCSVIVEDKIPHWMQGSTSGWITAEYGMLPGCSDKRIQRDKIRSTGRTHEIQRLIGRSLRASLNLSELGPRTVQIDCDVIQADGGTRVASITGAYLALRLALASAHKKGKLKSPVSTIPVAAVSLGKVSGNIILDLNYFEDVEAAVDANVVMNKKFELIEVQGTAEKGTFTRQELNELLTTAEKGLSSLFELQNRLASEWGV